MLARSCAHAPSTIATAMDTYVAFMDGPGNWIPACAGMMSKKERADLVRSFLVRHFVVDVWSTLDVWLLVEVGLVIVLD